MNKKLISIIGALILVLSVTTIVIFRNKNLEEQIIAESSAESSTEESTFTPAPIATEVKTPSSKTEEEKNKSKPESRVDTVIENGETIQRPNWEEQKELAPDTQLRDTDEVPQYKHEVEKETIQAPVVPTPKAEEKPTTTPTPTAPKQSETPKAPATPPAKAPEKPDAKDTPPPEDTSQEKVIDGVVHIYLEGFGWIPDAGENTMEIVEVELAGRKAGE